MCNKRHRFRSKAAADLKTWELAHQIGYRMSVYWCQECERWCLTSRKRHVEEVFGVIRNRELDADERT